MKCMYCGFMESKVVDSRPSEDGRNIRRRRECLNCGRRFTTYEYIETTPILVIKNDGTRQPFDANKIRNGIIRSCEKRPVALHDIDKMNGHPTVLGMEQIYTQLMAHLRASHPLSKT